MAEGKEKPGHKVKWIEGMEGVLIKEKPPKKPPSLIPAVIMGILVIFAMLPKPQKGESKSVVAPPNDYDSGILVEGYNNTTSHNKRNRKKKLGAVSSSSSASWDDRAGSYIAVSGDYDIDRNRNSVFLDFDIRNNGEKKYRNVLLEARYFDGNGREIWGQDVSLKGKFKPGKTRPVSQRIASVDGTERVSFTVVDAW